MNTPMSSNRRAESGTSRIVRVCRSTWNGFARILWKELFELYQKPSIPLGLLAAALLVVWTSGKINIEQPKIGVYLYEGGADEEALKKARAVLQQFAHLKALPQPGDVVDTNAMQGSGVYLALVYRGGQWNLLHRFATVRQEEEAARLVGAISHLLQSNQPPWALSGSAAGNNSRMSALPGEPHLQLVPRTIALIIVFLPFVLATRSYSREVASGTLPVLLGLPNCGWGTLAAGKLMACLWLALILLLALLLAINPMFGLSPKPGLLLQLGVQALATLASACLGLLLAVLARNQSQIHLSIAIYFLALVLLSGFLFPLETASPAIRWASYASPLTFSGKVLEHWLFFGTSAVVFSRDVLCLAVQTLCAAALLTLTIARVRHRI